MPGIRNNYDNARKPRSSVCQVKPVLDNELSVVRTLSVDPGLGPLWDAMHVSTIDKAVLPAPRINLQRPRAGKFRSSNQGPPTARAVDETGLVERRRKLN